MNQRTRVGLAGAAIVGLFLLVQVGALALVEPFKSAGLQPVENPQNPLNSVLYTGMLLVVTGLMLVAIRYDLTWVIRGVVVLTGAYISWIVLSALLPGLIGTGLPASALAIGGAAVLAIALYAYPEWYVIDAAGVLMGAGAAGLFGISFGILPALLLLTVLAVYDAISVYRTEHMLTLAEGVMDLRVPVVLVIPLSLSYSFLDAEMPATQQGEPNEGNADESDEGETDERERDALFIGLGDAVIPTVLIASAAFFPPAGIATTAVWGVAISVPALTAMFGTLFGLGILIRMVLKGRAHAGLPLLNGGAIAGYLVGALLSGVGLLEAIGLAPYL